MNTVVKKRFLVGTIIILIVINITALSTIVFQKYSRIKNTELRNNCKKQKSNKNRQKTYHSRVKHFVKKELNLSDEQFKQYVKLKDINIEKSLLIRQKIGEQKKIIFKSYCEDIQDTVILNKTADEIGKLHSKMQKETLRHFKAVEEILNQNQIEKFKHMLCNMSDRESYGMHKRYNKKNSKKNK